MSELQKCVQYSASEELVKVRGVIKKMFLMFNDAGFEILNETTKHYERLTKETRKN
jgi:hypothetical protein